MKEMKKTTKIRIFYMVSIVVADALFLPLILKFPDFLMQDLGAAPQLWFEYGFINSLKELLINDKFKKFVLCLPGASVSSSNRDRLERYDARQKELYKRWCWWAGI